jgi:FixJ family two-component response regulator
MFSFILVQSGAVIIRSVQCKPLFIVDDDEAAREATKVLVRSLGYNAFTFRSADEFLKSEQVHGALCVITGARAQRP